jgi:GntR family transcriptional regulator / MocR family aminotransferase
MTRQGICTVPMLLAIDRHDGGTTLHQQIYNSFRTAIANGRLQTGSRLPGSRVLADDLGVSRTTILTAYDRLRVEGYIEGQRGGGTRVAVNLPHSVMIARLARDRSQASASNETLSALGSRMVGSNSCISPARRTERPVAFALGVPALDAFPVATWARLTAQRWRTSPRLMLAPDDGPGYAPLRQAIAEYVIGARGLQCSSDQIVITAGSQQGIDLVARLLLNPGDSVWVEEYGYAPARAAFAGVGACPIAVPVDDDGLDVERGRELAPKARIAFVTPACEPPFAVAMSLRRRLELLDWAHQTGAWIVEDDYNGELGYQGKPFAALQGLDHPGAQRVIYLRTFTKTLFPALRLGYAVLPLELIGAFTRARLVTDRHSPTAEQAVLTDFIAGGHFARHMRTMRELYAKRQHAFLDLASHELGDLLPLRAASAGIRLAGRLQSDVSDQQVAAEAALRGVIVDPLSSHCPHARENGLALGYVPFSAGEARSALATLAKVIRLVQRPS